MANKTTAQLKTGRDFVDVLDSYQNYNNIERRTTTGAFTIGDDTSLLSLAVDGAMTPTMPAAKVGRRLKVLWEVEQATNDRVFTAAGSDTFLGNIFTSIEVIANHTAGFSSSSTPIAGTTAAITVQDDTNIGSYLEFQCSQDGQWLTTGHLVLDATGSAPTLA
tara:strand:+ start:502 stop:990 length:489 start_codon:yes stop_codon:yes gene_type:complete